MNKRKLYTEVDSLLESESLHDSELLEEITGSEPPTTFAIEFKYILVNSSHVVTTLLLQFSLTFISIYYVKQFGEKKLAAVSLSNTIYYISGPAIFNGFATSLDTLCSQAYGARNYYNVGLYCQRCLFLMIIVLIPIMFFHFNCANIFIRRFFLEDSEIIESCDIFLKILAFGSPGLVIFEVVKRFIQCQGIFKPPAVVLVCLFTLNLALNSFAVPRYGFIVIPILISMNYWLMGIGLLLYVIYTKTSKRPRKCFDGIMNISVLFHNMRNMLILSISGIIMVVSEAVAFQILTFMSCKLSIHEMAAQSIVSTIANGIFQLPFGIAICCCTRMANVIGSGNLSNLNILKRTYFFIASCVGIINFLFLFTSSSFLGQFFSPNEDPNDIVAHLTQKVLIITAINQFGDCFNIICAGMLRGLGRQTTGSILNFVSFYFIALPLEVYFAFKLNLGIQGLWGGLALGVCILALCELFCIMNLNWPKIILQSLARESKN